MPKTLTQHQIRQRAVQVLFSYAVQKEMATNVVSSFRENVEKLEEELSQTVRFDVDFRDERITVRKFPKGLSQPLEAIYEIYEILGLKDIEKTTVAKALAFMRDFGGYAKKMNEYEATNLFVGVMANLKLIRLFQIELDEEPVAPKVLEFFKIFQKMRQLNNLLKLSKKPSHSFMKMFLKNIQVIYSLQAL